MFAWLIVHTAVTAALAVLAAAAAVPTAQAPPDPTPISWDWLPAAALWAWAAGGVFTACRHGLRVLNWRRRLRGGGPVPDRLEALVRELAGSAGMKPPRLV